ncbi:MAG: molybdopterin-binding protein [Clostridiales Family XIII bacterium]|jgi:molybdenum cofactor synthesis domain-containing protein|nr:molybdopterin-binding protein [Clostridiales Family XIII bacterium]
MKTIDTQDAVGLTLCHDITRIVPGEQRKVAFRRGHTVREEDIPALLDIGKKNLYVWEDKDEENVHEEDAALYLAGLTFGESPYVTVGEVFQGRIDVRANAHGLFCSDTKRLFALNRIPDVAIAARHNLSPVRPGDVLAGMRIIPLVTSRKNLEQARQVAELDTEAVFRVLPYVKKRVAIVTTGSEVYEGRIPDGMGAAVRGYLARFELPHEEVSQSVVPDEAEFTTRAILAAIEEGADLVIVTGGMSVDPDDRTPLAIRNTGAEVVTYGTPVLPGSMYMMAYLTRGDKETIILGVPGGLLHSRRSCMDLLLPRLFAGLRLGKEDFVRMSNGGLCFSCETCIYPNCGFGME